MQDLFFLSCVLLYFHKYTENEKLKAVVQRVKRTTLTVDGTLISEIPFGLVVFLGVKSGDGEKSADYLMKKIANGSYLNKKIRLLSKQNLIYYRLKYTY